jgi:hypothetical protein
MFIMTFLSRVAMYKESNKMNPYAIAVVFAPCFLRPEKYSMEDLQEYHIHEIVVLAPW